MPGAQPDNDEIAALALAALPFGTLPPACLDAIVKTAALVEFRDGEAVYEAGSASNDLFIVARGVVLLAGQGPSNDQKPLSRARAFGWTALGEAQTRRYRATALGDALLIRLPGATLTLLAAQAGVKRDDIVAAIRAIRSAATDAGDQATLDNGPDRVSAFALKLDAISRWTRSPQPYLMLLGYAALLVFWWLSVEVLRLPRFAEMPGPTSVFREWLSPSPTYGVSLYTPIYYQHILISVRRVLIAFALATALGVPIGLLLGWSRTFHDYVFPLFEMVRPIPILAWVPLAIIMLPGSEAPVLFLTFLASFYATTLNTMLGVKSIDPHLILAAKCLGASPWRTFFHVIAPGAAPFIFTGLQISIGVAWFSLVAGEMVSGQFGLGYLINTSYTMVQYPTMVIAMLTLGAVGCVSSLAVRLVGEWLTGWRVRRLALDGA